MGAIVDFSKMSVGQKGSGKHWTKEEVEQREKAAQKLKRKKRARLRMPEWLDDTGQEVWKKTVKDMSGFDLLDRVDEDMLATYCDAVARYREASQKIREEGYTTLNAQGTETVSPYVKASQSYARLIAQYAEKLGLSPNGRARLAKKIAEEVKDPNADLFD